ncbi:MAG: hypothetical protein IJI53_14945 [Clostridia bacterium]|nr:hypothetical protein [Clostridia bacterium]
MYGQTKSYKEHQKAVDAYLKAHDPYQKPQPLKFDLRKYAAYVEQHKVDPASIPEEVLQSFYTGNSD